MPGGDAAALDAGTVVPLWKARAQWKTAQESVPSPVEEEAESPEADGQDLRDGPLSPISEGSREDEEDDFVALDTYLLNEDPKLNVHI